MRHSTNCKPLLHQRPKQFYLNAEKSSLRFPVRIRLRGWMNSLSNKVAAVDEQIKELEKAIDKAEEIFNSKRN